MQNRRRKNGATFCQVKIREELIQWNPSIIWGTQRWKGAAPNLIRSLSKINLEKKSSDERWPNNILPEKALQIKIAEAKAWIRKYFKVASELRDDLKLIKRAKSPSMLISRPIHAIIQEEAEIAIQVPRKITYENIIFQGRKRIKRRSTSIFGIWAQKLIN